MIEKINNTGELQQRVSEAAYFIWEAEGRPEGRALNNWLAAEEKVLGRFTASTASRAIRILFKIDGEQIEIIDREHLKMVVLPSIGVEENARRSGFWYELQDGKGNPLYRRLLRNPLSKYVEVPTGNPERPMAYERISQPSSIISIVIPDVEQASSLAFFASRPKPARVGAGKSANLLVQERTSEAEEIYRFNLH